MKIDQNKIRNFSIIAHIDHGKSTLADRILEATGTIEQREMKDQILDSMDLERERGITIKLNAVTLNYKADDGNTYIFNLIDTPGHVDFTYEVSRSLAACEGAILVVDATQGVEAQTLANTYLAIDSDLTILPVINKIDLPSARPDLARREIEEKIGIDCKDVVEVSAKTGYHIHELLETIVKDVPSPSGDPEAPLKALIFDSYYDSYRGVVMLIRIMDGTVKVGDDIRLMQADKQYQVTELGIHSSRAVKVDTLSAGEVGYLCAQIKNIKDVRPGDTVTLVNKPASKALPGYRVMNPMVFCGLYPTYSEDYHELKDALDKLSLSDASLQYIAESSQALGFGFRCGFLGLLHMDIVQERLEREYNLDLILTAPSVIYHVKLTDGTLINLDNPSKLPDNSKIDHIEEPYVKASIMTPKEYVGAIMELCQERRGVYQNLEYFDETRMILTYELPLAEIIYNFFDKLKSFTKGYASFDYEYSSYHKSDLVRLDVLLNSSPVDALSSIIYRPDGYRRGLGIIRRIKEVIPRQQFEIPIQAAIGGKVVARVEVKAVRKDVLAKCYGGDISRKKKLLEKQKEGKKRMKKIGSVEVPQEAFMSILSIDDDDN
ncbi:MAG TPA: translation elongation factor 4 [Bacilli bacterium]|jgi:GTP-binding protein LepA|nr:translation elongation factor 4 [Bacilli bacterium]HQA55554.1 translation elongation factor 4 [Bacilli bacterium]